MRPDLRIVGRLPDIRLVIETSPLPTIAMAVTFLANTALPLQDAIFIGAGLSMILFCVSVTRHTRLVALTRDSAGSWTVSAPPASAPSNKVTVLHYTGVSLFAEMARLEQTWPDTSRTKHAVIVLSLRTLPDVPSSTMPKVLERLHDTVDAGSNRLTMSTPPPRWCSAHSTRPSPRENIGFVQAQRRIETSRAATAAVRDRSSSEQGVGP